MQITVATSEQGERWCVTSGFQPAVIVVVPLRQWHDVPDSRRVVYYIEYEQVNVMGFIETVEQMGGSSKADHERKHPDRLRFNLLLWVIICCFATRTIAFGEPVSARHKQGAMHALLLLKSTGGKVIAVGDQVDVTRGNQVRSRLVFHFRDGSIDDETTVFRQDTFIELVSDHHIQQGPSFPEPLDMTVNVPSKQVTWHEMKDGRDEAKTQQMDIPPDLANGLMSPILENFPANEAEMKVSYIAGGSKPRIVKLAITRGNEDRFRVGGTSRRAGVFNIHIELGGVAGAVAPLIGKQPADIKVWVMDGEVPTVLKLVGALYQKGPIWTMMLTSPMWPTASNH